jgi:hypothetical protein
MLIVFNVMLICLLSSMLCLYASFELLYAYCLQCYAYLLVLCYTRVMCFHLCYIPICFNVSHMLMLWFFYVMICVQTQTHKQDVSVEVALAVVGSTAAWRGSTTNSVIAGTVVDSAIAGSAATSWRGSISWVTVRNFLSSMKGKIEDEVADRHTECWSGQWWRCTFG